jgi:hypothetical protein
MSNGSNGPWRGEAPTLELAFVQAWNKAKSGGANPGEYKVEISIIANNPIHTYVVTILPAGS